MQLYTREYMHNDHASHTHKQSKDNILTKFTDSAKFTDSVPQWQLQLLLQQPSMITLAQLSKLS